MIISSASPEKNANKLTQALLVSTTTTCELQARRLHVCLELSIKCNSQAVPGTLLDSLGP